MPDSRFPPGSRAIKIPISRLKKENYTTARRSSRDNSMQRTESTEGSSSEAGTSTPSTLSSRTKETSFQTQNTILSPAKTNGQQPFATPQPLRKNKQRDDFPPPNSVPTKAVQSSFTYSPPLSASMLSSSSYKSVNLNSHMADDEPPRLICYTKHSQGFTWNDELFLPSYLVGRRYRGSKNRRRWGYNNDDDDEELGDDDDIPFDEEADRCPVHDIFVTDEEAAKMLP